jgi:hypothetical protein
MTNCLFGVRNANNPCGYLPAMILVLMVPLITMACVSHARQSQFDPRTCMQSVPDHINGLRIVQGGRTEKNIIRDMVPAICNGQALFRTMQSRDTSLESGTAIFRVVVEYTGEVRSVAVQETTIRSSAFLSRISDMIENSDFVGWARDDTDTIFFYPVHFGSPSG